MFSIKYHITFTVTVSCNIIEIFSSKSSDQRSREILSVACVVEYILLIDFMG